MPSNLAEAMIRLLDNSSNEGLAILNQVLRKGEHALGNLWTGQLSQQAAQDLQKVNTVLPGLDAQFRAAQPNEQAQLPTIVDPQLLEGTTVNFPRSLVRLAWILQHAVTLLPMAGDIQAVLNSHHIPFSCCGQIPRPLQIHKQHLGTGQLRFRRNP